jgi:hypothetical protein
MILRFHWECFFAKQPKPMARVEIYSVLIDLLDPKKKFSDSRLARMGQNLIQQETSQPPSLEAV